MSDQKYAPGTVLSPEEAGIPTEEPQQPVAMPAPSEGPAVHGDSTVGSALRGVESGALAGFNEKLAAGIDTFASHHPWLADFAAKVSGDETLRDPSLTYQQRLDKYKQAAAESMQKHPVATLGGDFAGAMLPNNIAGSAAKVVTKGGEAIAGRVLGRGAERVAQVLAPAAEGAGIGALTAEGEDTDHARGALIGAGLGLAPSLATAAARPLARLVRKVPVLGGAPERIKPIQAAANAMGLGISDTKNEAERLFTAANEDPVVAQHVLRGEPSHEAANTLAQHTVDLKNKLLATALALPKSSAGKAVGGALKAMTRAVEAGDLQAMREAGVEAAKEAARVGLSPDQQQDIANQVKRLDTAARLAVAVKATAGHGAMISPAHPLAAINQGNLGPAATETLEGRPGMARALMTGVVKKGLKPIDRSIAQFVHAGETGNTAGIQSQARELMGKNYSPTRAALAAIEAKHGANAQGDEPVHTAAELAAEFKKMGMSDHEIARIIGNEYNKPLEKKLRAEGKAP